MTDPDFQSLLSLEWLVERLDDPQVVVLDASFKLPGVLPTAWEDYVRLHIPTAECFDVDRVADDASSLPHMLPDAEQFGRAVGAMGVGNDCDVVIYDMHGLMSAGRAWWMFRSFGHRRVGVLDGGLRAWTAAGLPVTAALPRRTAASWTPVRRRAFPARRRRRGPACDPGTCPAVSTCRSPR